MDYRARIKRLRKALDSAYLPVYPKSIVGGSNPYEKRTPYMEGWNTAAIQVAKNIAKALRSHERGQDS